MSDGRNKKKRKYDEGIMDGGFGIDEGSNGWWKVGSSSLLCSSPSESLLKRKRHNSQQQQKQQRNMQLSPLSRVGIVAIVVSSP